LAQNAPRWGKCEKGLELFGGDIIFEIFQRIITVAERHGRTERHTDG